MIKRTMILAAAAAVAGCAAYTPRENLSAMPADEVCYIEYIQGRNLSAQGKQAIQAEMQRRNDSCANHTAEVKQLFDDFMWRQTYLIQDP